jgi:hypothetical protein
VVRADSARRRSDAGQQWIDGRDRKQLERLFRYITRGNLRRPQQRGAIVPLAEIEVVV